MKNNDVFRRMEYLRHNHRRLEHLSSLGFDFSEKNILELGAGIGDHTHFYIDRGAFVVALEAREENIERFQEHYSNEIAIGLQHDLENPFFERIDELKVEKIDFIHCYGLLYHLKNPLRLIQECAKFKDATLLLETCVSYGNNEDLNLCNEDVKAASQSFIGTGCRPTRSWIFNNLKRNYKFVYMTITQPNHKEFPLDWTTSNKQDGLTRAVFIASDKKINHPLLSEFIVHKHTKSY